MSRTSQLQKIPMFFSRSQQIGNETIIVLAGDVGGTKTNLALFRTSASGIEQLREAKYHSTEFNSVTAIIKAFLKEDPSVVPQRICLGVAGPVLDGKVDLTNLSWDLDIRDIRSETGVQDVSLLNDLEATAYGLTALTPDDFIVIHNADGQPGNMTIVAPGTGLGEAGLYWDGIAYHPFPTEGGHADFSPRTALDVELYQYLHKKYGVVSWERVVAGPAIYDIYQFLLIVRHGSTPEWLQEAFSKTDPSAVVSQAAMDETDPICVETMELFVRYLARESSNMVLKMKATGGLFLGGGIPPKIAPLLQHSTFLNHFLDCDRMQQLLKQVPIRIILNDRAALLGAAYYGAYGATTL